MRKVTKHWKDIARQMGITQVMLIDADMNVHMTPKMAKRVRMEINPAPKIIVEEP